jgi:hypothetical protein
MSRAILLVACVAAVLTACQKPPPKPLKPIVQNMPTAGVIAPIIGMAATRVGANQGRKASA